MATDKTDAPEPKKAEKTLEMRVAELEDKLKGLQVTEAEMRAYNKVASLLGSAQQSAVSADPSTVAYTPAPDSCVVYQCIRPCTVVNQCTIRACTVRACTVVSACTIRACTIIQDCINECGGGLPGSGGFGGGFGNLGG